METRTIGIVQGDVIVRAALIAGLQELRSRPHLLDYVFAWLPKDELSSGQYGAEPETVKRWFLANNVAVVSGRRLDQAAKGVALVTVSLVQDSETGNLLSDTFYERVDHRGDPPVLAGPFVPESYDPYSGTVRAPAAVSEALFLAPGMVLVDRDGVAAPILEVLDAQTFRVEENLQLRLSSATVRGQHPAETISLRCAYFDQTFQIGCHVAGDQSRLIWLYTVVLFTLLRVRRRLLEGRGLDVSSLSGSDFQDAALANTDGQAISSRYITLRGKVLSSWPDDEAEVIQGVSTSFTVARAHGGDEEALTLGS